MIISIFLIMFTSIVIKYIMSLFDYNNNQIEDNDFYTSHNKQKIITKQILSIKKQIEINNKKRTKNINKINKTQKNKLYNYGYEKSKLYVNNINDENNQNTNNTQDTGYGYYIR